MRTRSQASVPWSGWLRRAEIYLHTVWRLETGDPGPCFQQRPCSRTLPASSSLHALPGCGRGPVISALAARLCVFSSLRRTRHWMIFLESLQLAALGHVLWGPRCTQHTSCPTHQSTRGLTLES